MGEAAAGDRRGLVCLVAAGEHNRFRPSAARLQWRQASKARASLAEKNRDLDDKVAELGHKAAELRQSVYLTKIALADREIAANNLARADQVLDECPVDQRGWEWDFLKQARHGNVRTASIGSVAGLNELAYSPDGKQIATAGPGASVVIRDAATLAVLGTLSGHTKVVDWMAFGADGARLASWSRDCTVRIWDTATRKTIVTIPCSPADDDGGVAYSLDGKWIALSGEIAEPTPTGVIHLHDAVTGRLIREFRRGNSMITEVEFSPDGRWIAATNGGSVAIIDITTGAVLQSLAIRDKSLGVMDLAFSHDGTRLAACAGDYVRGFRQRGELDLWEVADGREIFAVQAHTDNATAVAFHPDGQRGWRRRGADVESSGSGTPGRARRPSPCTATRTWSATSASARTDGNSPP